MYMLSLSVFGVSLFGLVALFVCKILELSRNVRTPLSALRRVGDPILIEGWLYYSNRFRKFTFVIVRAFVLWLSAVIRKTEAFFDSMMHTIAVRLNRYLRAKRQSLRTGKEVSAHLKTVLERTEKSVAETEVK